MNVSISWLQRYANRAYKAVSRRLTELWSFVDHKGNKQWAWLAIDAQTREIIGCVIGDRSEATARALWDSSPGGDRQCAVLGGAENS
ncbi:MAG: IS1 family transposase [Symploca sp. SIO2B6]|nr:IS1 family transposase [Symploca sp. SIO2B6]